MFLLFLILSAREIRLKEKFIFVYCEFCSCGTSEHCLWRNVCHKQNNSIGPLASSVLTPHGWLKWLGKVAFNSPLHKADLEIKVSVAWAA